MDLWDRYWPAHFFFKFITASGLQTTKKRLIHISMTCESSTAPQIPNIHISCICSFHEKTTSRRRICHMSYTYMVYVHRSLYFYATHKYIYRDVVTKIDFASSSAGHHQFPQGLPLKKIAFIFCCSFFSVYMFAPPHTKKNPN